jgi:hypothetical protein
MENDGDVVWLKGHTGRDEAAYLVFKSTIANNVRSLLVQPLPELGVYTLTGEPEPVEILRKYYRDDKIGVGRLIFWEEQVGEEILDRVTEIVRKGFWFAPIGTPTGAIFLKAQRLSKKWHEGETWLCFHEVEEQVCNSKGELAYSKQEPELWIRLSALDQIASLEERMMLVVPAA